MEYLRSYLFHAGFVPSVALVLIFVALLRGVRDSMWRIALLSLPGTIAHELAHFVVGLLLLAKPRGFSIWPRAQGNTWRLGSVSFGNIDPLSGAFVDILTHWHFRPQPSGCDTSKRYPIHLSSASDVAS
jgi:hypothetical protein